MILKTYFMFDIRYKDPDPEKRQEANDFIEVVTPLCKAYPTDEAWWLIGEAIQAYGGYGYCEEYPVAQIARDVKIYSIWEGTNFIQSLDLIGRKWTMIKGSEYAKWFKQVQDSMKPVRMHRALRRIREVRQSDAGPGRDTMAIGGYSVPAIRMMPLYPPYSYCTSMLFGAWCILEQALIAQKRAEELGADHFDYDFYVGKVYSARYFLNNVVPQVWTIADIVKEGDTSALDIPLGAFDY